MKTIILPGYSPHNRDWAVVLAAEIPGCEVHPWAHWSSGASMDAAQELTAILQRIGSEKVNLLAKSVGCRLAAAVVQRIPGQVERLILCGIPSTAAEVREGLASALDRIPAERVLVVQNRADPYAPFREVEAMLRAIAPQVEIREERRDDHHYPFTGLFKTFLEAENSISRT